MQRDGEEQRGRERGRLYLLLLRLCQNPMKATPRSCLPIKLNDQVQPSIDTSDRSLVTSLVLILKSLRTPNQREKNKKDGIVNVVGFPLSPPESMQMTLGQDLLCIQLCFPLHMFVKLQCCKLCSFLPLPSLVSQLIFHLV